MADDIITIELTDEELSELIFLLDASLSELTEESLEVTNIRDSVRLRKRREASRELKTKLRVAADNYNHPLSIVIRETK